MIYATAAKRETVDAGNHGLSQVFDEVEHGLSTMSVFLTRNRIVFGQFADVGAGNECLLA
jgi:hypothetical protein